MREERFTTVIEGVITEVNISNVFSIVNNQATVVFPLKGEEYLYRRVIFMNAHVKSLYHRMFIGEAIKEDKPTWCEIPLEIDNLLSNNTVVMVVTIKDGCGG